MVFDNLPSWILNTTFILMLHYIYFGVVIALSISWIQYKTHHRSCICKSNNPSKAIFITSAAPFLFLLLFSELRISDIAICAGVQSVLPRRFRNCREGVIYAFDGILHVSSIWMESGGREEKQKICMDCFVPSISVPRRKDLSSELGLGVWILHIHVRFAGESTEC